MIGGFIADAWNALTGKPQSWYTNVSNIQNQLSVLLAGVTAIGGDVWDTVSSAQGPTQDGSSVSMVDAYSDVVANINSALRTVIVTTSYVPSDTDIAAAQATATQYQGQLSLVESMAPELSDVVAQDQQQVQSMLPTSMVAPAPAAQAEFAKALADRAAALGAGILDWTQYLAWGLGAAAVLYVASMMNTGRSKAVLANPRRRSRRSRRMAP
jgi:hypothetical protein